MSIKKKKDSLLLFFIKGKRPFIFFALISFLIYAQTLRFDFTYLDDYSLIEENKNFLKDISNFFKAFSQSVFSMDHDSMDNYYRPLLTISFLIDFQIGGLSPFVYHFTNILLHIIATCLLYVFFIKLNYKKEIVFLICLLLTAHPALTKTIAWIPGRNDSLLAIFILGSFIFLLDFFQDKSKKNLAIHFLFFFSALLTKESAVLIIPLFLFFGMFTYRSHSIQTSQKLLLAAGWTIFTGTYFLLRKNALEDQVHVPFSAVFAEMIHNLPAIIHYMGKILIPINLSTYPVMEDGTIIYGLITITAMALLIIWTKKWKSRFIHFGIAWILLMLLPAILRTNMNIEANFLEHRLYIPMVGFFMVLAESVNQKIIQNKYFIFSFSTVLILFSANSFGHAKHFRNEESFWKNAVETSPHSSVAHSGMGIYYHWNGDKAKAKYEYEKAIGLNQKIQSTHNNLGKIFLDEGDTAKAEALFRKEISLSPKHEKAYYNLGVILLDKGNLSEAERLFKKQIEIAPNYTDAINDLAAVYGKLERFDESILLWKKVVEIDPNHIPAYKNLVIVLSLQNKNNEASIYKNKLREKGMILE